MELSENLTHTKNAKQAKSLAREAMTWCKHAVIIPISVSD